MIPPSSRGPPGGSSTPSTRSGPWAGERWFARHGGTSVLIGRCVPVVRSLVSIPAGVERMPLVRFLAWTTLGSAVDNAVLVTAGYGLGSRWTEIGRYSEVIDLLIYAAFAVAVGVFVTRRLRTRRRPRER